MVMNGIPARRGCLWLSIDYEASIGTDTPKNSRSISQKDRLDLLNLLDHR